MVSVNYFHTLRIPLLTGRTFSADDSDQAVVVSQAVVDHFWPGGVAVGRRIRFNAKDPWKTIIGVVGNVEMRLGDDRLPRQLYSPLDPPRASSPQTSPPRRRTYSSFVLTVRAVSVPSTLPALKAQVWAVDKNLPVENLRRVADAWDDAFGRQRFALQLMAVFATIAVVLAAAGIFAVVSQSVSQRTREIGVRVALGATRRDVFHLIVARGMGLTAMGVGIGVAGATALTRLLESLLFEVSPHDPGSFASMTVVLIAVAFLACWLPTRRAMRVDPSVALRVE
jgi:putative ABC transport system permease protein